MFISSVFGAKGKVAANHHSRTSSPPPHLASRASAGASREIFVVTSKAKSQIKRHTSTVISGTFFKIIFKCHSVKQAGTFFFK